MAFDSITVGEERNKAFLQEVTWGPELHPQSHGYG